MIRKFYFKFYFISGAVRILTVFR